MTDIRYCEYDADHLTLQYLPSMTVTDSAAHIERWQKSSDVYRQRCGDHGHLDIAYGESPGERLDIFCQTNAAAPVHVYIHGGYWQRTDKSDYSFLAETLVGDGVCVVIPNYSLCPLVTVDEIVREMRRALAWVYLNIADYGGDPQRIHISGHSAGGHLTAMMALTDWTQQDNRLPADLVKSGVPISGVFDLLPLVYTPINDPLGLNVDTARQLSPLFMGGENLPPLGFAVGGDESDEFRRQNQDMASHWSSLGGDMSIIDCPARHHFNVIENLTDPSSHLYRSVSSYLHEL